MEPIILYDYTGSICSQMARLALVEKGLTFDRRQIDIMETNEQFEPWYVALNPRAVVPTLKVGEKIVTDTIRIVNKVQDFSGPDLSGNATTQGWLRDIMALHYGVFLYRNRLDPDSTAPQIVARGQFLKKLLSSRPDLAKLIEARIKGNSRLQAILKDPVGTEIHVKAARELVARMADALDQHEYLAGRSYSLADCFATAALARFTIHGFDEWWQNTALIGYYSRMKARPSFLLAVVIDTGVERDI